MSDKTYNGWTNYETWNVALHIGNEEYSYRYWEQEQSEVCYREAVENDTDSNREEWESSAVSELADRLKTEFVDNAPVLDGCYGDLLSGALSEVNWYEIAKNYIENVDKDSIEKDVLPEPEVDDETEADATAGE